MPVVTIQRSEHAISRKALSPNAVRVLYRLHDHGFVSYLVGGCVRDLLLGREPKDFDIVTDATPSQMKKLFRNCRLVGRRFRLAHLHFQDEIIEVATFRSLQTGEFEEEPPEPENRQREETHRTPRHLKDTDGMILRDNVFGTPEEDARRRDITINALFYNIADFSIMDHVGGMYDLENGIIRVIGDPNERFIEDPVRMLRAVRFAALLGFAIEESTWKAIIQHHDAITWAAPARLYEEMLKLFLSGEGARVWQLLRQTGLLASLFPHFEAWLGRESSGFPHTGPIHALEWVDGLIQQGEKVSPPLLFALLFGQFIDEKAETSRGNGTPFQQSLDAAVAELSGELAQTVLIPNRVAVMIRTIFATQRRFQKTPGRQPQAFVARHGFAESLQFLLFRTKTARTGTQLYDWWYTFASETEHADLTEQAPQDDGSPKKKRRRKRRRRRFKSTSPSVDTTPSDS